MKQVGCRRLRVNEQASLSYLYVLYEAAGATQLSHRQANVT